MTLDLGGVRLYRRSEWNARRPRSRQSLAPSYGTTVHWEGPRMGSFPHVQCASKVRAIQDFHMDTRGWQDVAYTALFCPHGYVFEGRWVGVRTAANGTSTGNSRAYAVCYLGGVDDPFTAAARGALRVLLEWLDRHGAGPGRNCHRDWKPTQCPGDAICSWVRTVGQGDSGVPRTRPGPEPTRQKVNKMLWLIKGAERPEWWLTDWLVKRHVRTPEDAAVVIWMAAVAGQPVQHDEGNQPLVLAASQQDVINRIPEVD